MRTTFRVATLSLLAALIALASAASGQDRQDNKELAELLARPVSPGTLVMLMPHVNDERVPEQWRRALWNADPRVRRIAARLLHIAGASRTARSLEQVLAAETDSEAAFEIATALLAVGGADANAAVLAAAGRLSAGRLAIAIAQARGRAALALLDKLYALRLSTADRIEVTRLIAGGSRTHLEGIGHVALESGNAELWQSVLSVAQADSLDLGSILDTALTSATPAIRGSTWWHIAVLLARNHPVPTTARMPASSPPIDVGDPLLAFGREMADRVLKHPAVENPKLLEWLRAQPNISMVPTFIGAAMTGPLFQFLTPAEQEALYYGRPEPQRFTDKKPPPFQLKPSDYRGDYRTMRTVSGVPEGLALDLMKQMGCKPGEDAGVGGAVVRYDEARSLRAIEYIQTALGKPCDMAARYLSLISATPPTAKMIPEKKEIMLLPMHKWFLTCLHGPANPRPSSFMENVSSAVPVGRAGIMAPKKTRMVNPIYPAGAQAAGRQGIVIIEATITPEGCVSEGEILQSAAPDLDVSAMRAVTAWHFTPTLINGTPVPVIMTVTVQFSLQ